MTWLNSTFSLHPTTLEPRRLIGPKPPSKPKHVWGIRQQLFLYGPFIDGDTPTAPSNLEFDQSLRRRNLEWGIRHLDHLVALAATRGLGLSERLTMPTNNLVLVFRKT